MNFALAIDRNRQDLLRIAAMLFASAGLVVGGSVAVLPRQVRCKVLRYLRSAEAALRRLLVVTALGMSVQLRVRRTASAGASKTDQCSKGLRKPSFPVIESVPGDGESETRFAAGPGPRLSFLDRFDPSRESLCDAPTPNDAVNAAGLCNRLSAFQTALTHLPKHARRIALWQARCDAAAQARRDAGLSRSGRYRPVRLGRPAGYRARGKHSVDGVLIECHALMLYALRQPDTG